MREEIEPLDATGFREACVELIGQWDEVGEDGEPVDGDYAFEFFQSHYAGLPVDTSMATYRFLSLMDALEEAPLCEFVTSLDGGAGRGLHSAIFESAAHAPMSSEGQLDVTWIAKDLGRRLLQIATLENLLNSDET